MGPTSRVPESRWVDPELRPILQQVRERAASRPAIGLLPVSELRRRTRADLAVWNENLPRDVTIRDTAVKTTLGSRTIRLFSPPGGDERDLVVWLHGGGFVVGDLDTHAQLAAEIAMAADVCVALPDYVLSPEHPFPEPVENCVELVAALLDARQQSGRWYLGGDSAGAALAVAAAIRRRGAGHELPAALALAYGAFSPRFDTASHRAYGDDFGLTTEAMRYFWRSYLGDSGSVHDADLLAADLAGLPPHYLIGAGLDPLLADTVDYADRLCTAGVPCRVDYVPGVIHGFIHMTSALGAAKASVAAIAGTLAGHRRNPRK